MKSLRKILFLGIIASLAVFTACEKEEEDNLSYEEGKEVLNNLDSQMASDIEMMSESEGMTAIATLNGMSDPFTQTKSNKSYSILENIENFALPVENPTQLKSLSSTEPFNFSEHTGTYTWIDSLERWKIDPTTPSDKIVINFPADSTNMDDNNATLTIHNYVETEVSTGTYEPTLLMADLTINDTKYVEIDMEAAYNNAGEPSSLDLNVFLKPFTFNGSMTSSTDQASVDFAINYNDEQIFSTGLSATYTDQTMEEPKVIDGYIQYRNVKIEANINAENLIALMEDLQSDNPSYETMDEIVDAINKEIDAKVLSDGNKVADIEVRYSEEIQDFTLVLVFNDGTEENAEEYFDNFSTRLEEFFEMLNLQLESEFDSF